MNEVNNWMHLGLNLGLKLSALEAIQTDKNTTADHRNQMLIDWQKQVTPTWYAVVQALVSVELNAHARIDQSRARAEGVNLTYRG